MFLKILNILRASVGEKLNNDNEQVLCPNISDVNLVAGLSVARKSLENENYKY